MQLNNVDEYLKNNYTYIENHQCDVTHDLCTAVKLIQYGSLHQDSIEMRKFETSSNVIKYFLLPRLEIGLCNTV